KHLMVHAQEQLARLWNIQNDQMPIYLERELNLIKVDKIVERYLDNLNFAGTYIDVRNNLLIIYTVNIAKKKDIISKPDVREHVRFLDFRNASKSLDNLKSSFGELVIAAKQIRPKGIEGFINPRINNIAVIITRRPFDRDNRAFIEIAVRNGAVVYFGDYNPPRHTKR
ncbi:16260_t:CDS:1, partial [Racocetra persica]